MYFNLYISLFPYTPCARTARCITYVQLLSRGPVGLVKTQCRVHDLMGGRDDWR